MDGESQEERDKRVEKLWRTLDIGGQGELDIHGLKKGLKRMDHPLKNADALLHDVLKAVDTSGDGQIQFNEFRVFVEHAERELLQLFESIDRDHNGELDKNELKTAFSKAGLAISNAKLDQFFDEVDVNHDGVISFDEWRNFLLFIPAGTQNLRAIISYYSSTATVSQDADVHINDGLQGVVHQQRKGHNIGSKKFLPLFFQRWTSHNIVEMADALSKNMESLGYFVAGGLAGMISRTATAPLDRLKVYLISQTSTQAAAVDAVKDGEAVKAAKNLGRPLIEACKELWRAGGIRSLFAGNGLNVLKVMPESAIKFGAYEASKRMFAKLEGHDDSKHLHPASQFLAGGIGGVVSQCVVYPLDTLKFRMQCETVSGGLRGNALISQTASKMWRQNGLVSYYRGLGMGLAGMFPYSAIDLFIFENCKRLILARKARIQRCHEEDVDMGNVATGIIGACSGAISATVVYPVNLLRTRLQAQGTVLHPPTYTGIVDVTKKTLQGEGVRGLFKGVTPNLLKVAPAVSISYVVYENAKNLMGLH